MGLTERQGEILKNASIGLFTSQLYTATTLMQTNGSQHTIAENIARLKTCSVDMPEQYRCRKLDLPCDFQAPFRTLDGTCNNIQRPYLGATYSQYSRLVEPIYSDGNFFLKFMKFFVHLIIYVQKDFMNFEEVHYPIHP